MGPFRPQTSFVDPENIPAPGSFPRLWQGVLPQARETIQKHPPFLPGKGHPDPDKSLHGEKKESKTRELPSGKGRPEGFPGTGWGVQSESCWGENTNKKQEKRFPGRRKTIAGGSFSGGRRPNQVHRLRVSGQCTFLGLQIRIIPTA